MKFSLVDMRNMVEEASDKCFESNDYGSYDNNRGVSKLRRSLLRRLAGKWVKEKGYKDWFFDIPDLGLDNGFIAFHCLKCNEYHILKNISGERFMCPSCGQLHIVNREWNITYIE